MLEFIERWLIHNAWSTGTAHWLVLILEILLVAAAGVLANYVTRRIILRAFKTVVRRTRATWDDVFLERNVFDLLAHFAPAVVVYLAAPHVLAEYPTALAFITGAVHIYLIVLGILVTASILDTVNDIYSTFPIAGEIPIKGFLQLVKIALVFVGFILVLSIILGRTPLYLLSGLGALTAVLMLIFKDSILGFVAGIQLISNKMLAPGDWIEMSKYGADGSVIDISLTTVKVQNWDKTITTVPTYALITDSFVNWRGMQASGGRRIKRAVLVDLQTIRFCDEEMLHRFAKIRYIADYIERKKRELAEDNTLRNVDEADLANRRRLTNVGTFRAYVEAYLRAHPRVKQDMTFLVRQLAPNEHGLPIEIYVFASDIRWSQYEAIQADIFDHILAIVPLFDLRVYQQPSGTDFRAITR